MRPAPFERGRKHLRDLIVYELMLDDFTDEFREARAPLDAVRDKLDYLQHELGVNAILFMPWTAWPSASYSWGYIPYQYFSVEYRYANALGAPSEKLSWLKRLVDDCHRRGLHARAKRCPGDGGRADRLRSEPLAFWRSKQEALWATSLASGAH